MNKRVNGILASAFLLAGIAITHQALANISDIELRAEEQRQLWRFKVSLDKREIGFHDFLVTGEGSERTVEINADFDVKILFINAYSYDHGNRETWKDGCLQQIKSETDDNGERVRVSGETVTDGFSVETSPGGSRMIDSPCVRSFAYWNPEFLQSSQLLNAQTGEFVEVNIVTQGEDTLMIGGQPVLAMRYQIEMANGPITLWYSRDSTQWLALQASTKGGRLLRYEPVQLPFLTIGDSAPLAES